MKRYAISLATASLLMFFPLLMSAQERGAAGKLLSNETKRNPATQVNVSANYQYQWQQPYDDGYSEIFIRIPEKGRFSVRLDNQEIVSPTGMYRFFDVLPRPQSLTISQGRRVLYSVTLSPRNNTRLVLDFFSENGLYLLEEVDLSLVKEVYYGRRWNEVWNDSYGNHSVRTNVMNSTDFKAFMNAYTRQSFDKDRMRFFKMQLQTTAFTTQQIAALMNEMSFDDTRLELAKLAYANVIDPQNYYQLYEYFSFTSSADKLSEFISNQ